MVDREIIEQENKRLNSRLRKAKLRHQACMENIDYRTHRGLDKSLMKLLSQYKWIKERLNVLITGPCGVGKSFIACRVTLPDIHALPGSLKIYPLPGETADILTL